MLMRHVPAMSLALYMMVSAPVYAGNHGLRAEPSSNSTSATLSRAYTTATADEAADMLFMREEEKLARDVYLTLYDAWGLSTFTNIAASEQSHMNAMLLLLEKYRLSDPAAGNLIGEFTDFRLQALYDALIASGLQSAVDGVMVGGLIEEVDMNDIQAAIDRSTQADIDAVYANLMCGSRNHLRAFAGAFEALTGTVYQAQLLDPAVVSAILAAPMERCGGR